LKSNSEATHTPTRLPFTKARLIAASAWYLANSEKAQLDCYDTECVGLMAVLYRSSRIQFRARCYYQGQRLSIPLGDLSQVFGVEQARLANSAIRLDIAQGRDPRAARRASITFGRYFLEHYLPAKRGRKKSLNDDVQKFECRIRECFGHRPIASIKSADLVAFLAKLHEKEGLAPATANRYLALFKAIFRHAVENEVIPKSPATHIKPLLESNERTRFLNERERAAFIEACKQDASAAGVLFIVLLLTGARLGEALAAKGADISWDAKSDSAANSVVWFLPMTKTQKSARILLSDATVSLLRKYLGTRRTGYLFPGKDKITPMARPARAFTRICDRAGISTKNFCIHDLRRTWGTVAVNAGIPLFTVSKALRHSSPNVTATRYAHLQDQTLIDANEIVSALMCRDAKKAA
jgi:integrase